MDKVEYRTDIVYFVPKETDNKLTEDLCNTATPFIIVNKLLIK
jgi:hypothetical protein